jgi:hypothetical protein
MKDLARHSPAVVIATVALAVAATGTALGGPTRSTATVTPAQAKKIAKSVADAEIKRLAPSLSVKSAQTAAVANVATAPAVYAQVTAAGVVTVNVRGVAQANVTRARSGLYCFSGLAAMPRGGVAIIDEAIPGSGSGVDLVQVGLGRFVHKVGSCPEGTQAYVITFTPTGELVDDPFFVLFWS